jgi:hypothetical protein
MAFAAAEASAEAVADAQVRASASAETAAIALALAYATAEAAASAATSASASVQVVPDIETSVRAFIDPECLQPVCEEYEPCPPCPPCPEPGEPTYPEGCPEPEDQAWKFGEVQAGVFSMKSAMLPPDIRASFEPFDIVNSYEITNTLPSGSMTLNTTTWTETFSGTLPAGTYHVLYGFIDAKQCPVGTLDVWINASGRETPEVTPTPEPEEGCVRISSFCVPQQRISLLTLLTGGLTEFSTTMTINNVRYSTEFTYCGEEGTRFMVCTPQSVYAEDQSQRVFAYWAAYDETEHSWEPFSESNCTAVTIEDGAWIAAFYRCEMTSGSTPQPPPSQEVCVKVSAFYLPPEAPPTTTPTYKPGTPQYLAGPVPFQTTFTKDDKYKILTGSQQCGQPGESFKICAHPQVWTSDQQQLVFQFWAKYNEGTETWNAFDESTCTTIRLQEGGWLGAFYRIASP